MNRCRVRVSGMAQMFSPCLKDFFVLEYLKLKTEHMKDTKKIRIHKLGGACLMLSYYNLARLVRLILKEKKSRIVFVVSALENVTRILDYIFLSMSKRDFKERDDSFKILKEIHLKRARDLKIEDFSELEKILLEIELFIKKDHISENKTIDQAHLLSFGELLSSQIFNQFVSTFKKEIHLIDAKCFMVSQPRGSFYIESRVCVSETTENINFLFNRDQQVIVTQGYISVDGDSRDCGVLGYNGSDLSAAVIAYALLSSGNDVQLTYWKDVLGVLKDLKYPTDIFPVMRLVEYTDYSGLNSVPVRPDSLELLISAPPDFRVNIRSFQNLNSIGTILKP